jgi:hypothetical protein
VLVVVLLAGTTLPRPKRSKSSTAPAKRPRDVRFLLLQGLLDRLAVRVARLPLGSAESVFCSGHLAAARHYASTGEFGAALWSGTAVARKLRCLSRRA